MTSLRRAIVWVRQIMTDEEETIDIDEDEIRNQLGWLIDVPLFIDKTRTTQLYDITVQPIFDERRYEETGGSNRDRERKRSQFSGSVKAGLESNSLFSHIAGGKLSAKLQGEKEKETENETEVQYELTQTPQRQLAQIAIQYYYEDQREEGSDVRNYYYVENAAQKDDWRPDSTPSDPRDLVILELPGIDGVTSSADSEEQNQVSTKLVPTAAEFEDGSVVELYQRLEERYEKPPRYPERGKRWEDMGDYFDHIDEDHPISDIDREGEITDKQIDHARNYYWRWFEEKFKGKKATQIVEQASEEHGDIRWIDFRLPLNEHGDTLHLHVQSREEYNTGTFAYNLIKRGYKHGLILVGTVKSEPDMDVLAIYER